MEMFYIILMRFSCKGGIVKVGELFNWKRTCYTENIFGIFINFSCGLLSFNRCLEPQMISLLYRGLSKGFFPKDLGSYNYGLFRNILKDIYKDFIKIISKELSKLPSFFFIP